MLDASCEQLPNLLDLAAYNGAQNDAFIRQLCIDRGIAYRDQDWRPSHQARSPQPPPPHPFLIASGLLRPSPTFSALLCPSQANEILEELKALKTFEVCDGRSNAWPQHLALLSTCLTDRLSYLQPV